VKSTGEPASGSGGLVFASLFGARGGEFLGRFEPVAVRFDFGHFRVVDEPIDEGHDASALLYT